MIISNFQKLTFLLPDSNRQNVVLSWTNHSYFVGWGGSTLKKRPYYASSDIPIENVYSGIIWQPVKVNYSVGNEVFVDKIETNEKWYYLFEASTPGCYKKIYSKVDSFAIESYFDHKKGRYIDNGYDYPYLFADMNNDDLQDYVSLGYAYLGNGIDFKYSKNLKNSGQTGKVLSVADYDNNGYNDILFQDRLQMQFPQNDLSEIREYISWNNESNSFFSDLDNDGKLDIVRSTPFNIIHNKANDVNTTLSNSFFGTDTLLYAIPIDVNNDLKTDLAFTKRDSIVVYINEGAMSFKKRIASYIKGFNNCYSYSDKFKVEINDYNNDGWDDIYACNAYYINQKNNSFLQDEQFNNFFKIGDIDNNGYTDAIDKFNQIKLYQTETTYKTLNNAAPSLYKLIDSNNDGYLDVFGYLRAAGDYGYSNMFINNKKLSSNNGIIIKCVGVTSNRSAIGAVVRLKTKINNKNFTQFKKITEGVVHFGVGELNTIDTIEVRFPSGKIVLHTNVVPNRLLTIYEEPLPPLPTPNSLVAKCRDFKTADLIWKAITGDYAGLIIERSLYADKDFEPIDTLFDKSTTFKDSSLMRGLQYFYRIRIFRDGRKSEYSNVTNVFIFTTCELGAKLLNPAIIEAKMGDWVELNVQSNEKVSYRWYNYDTQSVVSSDSDTSSTFKVPLVGKNYFYRLKYAAIAIKNNQCLDTTNPVEIIIKSQLFKYSAKKDRDLGFWEQHGISNSSWADFDNDGDDDVIISGRFSSFGRRFYRNEGNNTFSKMNIPVSPNIDSIYSNEFLSWGDYNNDGNIDICFADRYQDIVLKNKGNGSFEKQSVDAMPYKDWNISGIWHDLNNDGFLDIIACHADSTFIFLNNKGNNFVPSMSLTRTDQQSMGIIDYNNDGLDDILLIGYNRSTKVERLYYYQNKGNGIFTEIESKTLNNYFNEIGYWNLNNKGTANNINILDIDNDGLLDIFLSRKDLVQTFLINKGNGIFEPTIIEGLESLTRDKTYFETVWADYDNNGWLDCLVSNDMYMALGNGKYVKDTLLGYRDLQYNGNYDFRSMFADTDNDGFLEVLQNCLFKSESFDTYRLGYYLFENAKNNNHWLTIKAKGTKSNRLGIGTTVNVIINLNGKKLTLTRRIMGQTSTTGQSPQKAYFGLGNATIIDSLIVKFPSGIVRKFTNIPVDQILEISEDESVLPTFALSVEGKDTCMNKVTITLKVTNGQAPYKYVWSNGETTPSVSNLSRGIYTVTVTDAANGKVIKEFNVKTCVWPGDTDSSGVVNHFDLLNIGLNYNMVGLTRSGQDQNVNWYGHKADTWSKNTVNTTVNVNHSDSDGDGFVSYKDTAAINLHWEKKHNLKSPNSTSSSTLNAAPPISIETSPVSENKRYSFPIILGDNDNLVSAIYGLGFSIDYDINKINANSINVTFDKCWLGKDILTISKNFEDIGRMEVALVRKNGFNINGKGQIGTLNFTFKNGVSNSSLSFGIKNSKAIDNTNRILILSEKVTSSTITAVGDVNWDSKILVYPNPVETMLNIESNDLEIKQVELFDFRGIKLLNIVSKSLVQTIDMKDFSNSFYILKISTDKGIVMKKVIKTN
jgi:ASPIC and UnbV/FG-GAP-like repeat/Secretion system C-terminal sorting domain